MGPAPLLPPAGVTDLTNSLSRSDQRALLRATAAFHRRFPQCRAFLLLKEFAPQFPLGFHLFWIFNTAGLSGEAQKFGRNHDVLIGLDPAAKTAGLIVGYGLEPFLPQAALEQVIDSASSHIKKGKFATGLTTALDRLAELMEGICRDLPSQFGIDHSFITGSSSPGDY
jgi:uncharacterized membrane protein YgcG